jgi:hypothetical protein
LQIVIQVRLAIVPEPYLTSTNREALEISEIAVRLAHDAIETCKSTIDPLQLHADVYRVQNINASNNIVSFHIRIYNSSHGIEKLVTIKASELREITPTSLANLIESLILENFNTDDETSASSFTEDLEALNQATSSNRRPILEAQQGWIDIAGTTASDGDIMPRVEAAKLAIEDLIEACARSNRHRDLLRFSEAYRSRLDALKNTRPALAWYVAAQRIELYRSNYVAGSAREPDEYPPLEPGLATLIDAVVIATAMLARILPEIARCQDQIQQYAGEQINMRRAVRDLVDPILSALSVADSVLTPRAAAVTAEAAALNPGATAPNAPEAIRATATKAGLLRGFLEVTAKLAVAATHQITHLRDNLRAKGVYDVSKEIAKWLVSGGYGPTLTFITTSAAALWSLASQWPQMFDFVAPLLRILGL